MTRVEVRHDKGLRGSGSTVILPIQLYGRDEHSRGDVSVIGNQLIEKIRRLGIPLGNTEMDFLSIALAVTAADTFVKRDSAADGWARNITLEVPLCEPERWLKVKSKLESALRFLSGDIWKIEMTDGGREPPKPFSRRSRLIELSGLDCTCLFSGGLDSTIGAIDLLETGRKPLLISHAYGKDKSRQEEVSKFLNGRYSRFSVNFDPHTSKTHRQTDISMRTRSINFLALAVIGSYAVKTVNQLENVQLYVPENGFISLNAPLTPRRIGSLSTRTTHPYFLSAIQDIFDSVGIAATIISPYRFYTKGEMMQSCKNQGLLSQVLIYTVSCSHWKRTNQQCGRCYPCLVRRSAIEMTGHTDPTPYKVMDLGEVLDKEVVRDDLFALQAAMAKLKNRSIGPWIMDSGPLPNDQIEDFKRIFVRGLSEVESFLARKNMW